ncbi:DUF3888 domain-containing protein [Cohnella mopanensis]|uniref:DUF3888 domain-containing protein n=1 Tax=Cohnella mopanensis TaxID=2911966 RepID=UPI001EF7E08F|nr:DUF3888 domain-containing protein [Cohnella mopanensis]
MKKFIFTFIVSLVLIFSFQTNMGLAKQPTEDSEELRLQDMLMNLLTPYITEVLDHYYRPKILKTFSPEITPWKIEVIETKRINGFRGFKLEITFEIEPTAGHHVPVGKDRLTYRISYGPSVELTNHTHLATYQLPPELHTPN